MTNIIPNSLSQRKRKLAQFLKDKFIASAGLASKVSSSAQENGAKLSRGQLSHASSVSCLLNAVDPIECFDQKTLLNSSSSGLTFEDNLQGKHISSRFSYLDDVADWAITNKYISPLVDTDESVNGSNPMTPEKPTHYESPSLDCYESVPSTNCQKKKPKGMYLKARRRSIRLQNFIGDHLQRLTIPIGPRFQADVPDWADLDRKECLNSKDSDSENSKWLGTRIWPIEGRKLGANTRTVGKGRPDSCSCGSPGSTDCIKRHVFEKSRSLQSEVGPVFFKWKFDEMGEAVSKSWTLKEQQSFESLVKTYSPSNGKNLLKHALRCYPRKCRKSIVSYYLNVFVPRHMRLQTRSNLKLVDSDDDKVENVKNVDLLERCKSRNRGIGGAKDMKNQYLRQRR